jgi:acyl-CoA thioester hydrolase
MTGHFTYSCALRWSDMDANGHVNNTTFGRYFEDARVGMLYDLLPAPGPGAPRTGFIVARQNIHYLAPLVHRPEPVTVKVWTACVRAVFFDLVSEVRDADRVCATAWTTVVGYDFARDRIRPLRREERERLERHRGDPPQAVRAPDALGGGFAP